MLMANRPSSGRGPGTKSDRAIEPQALVRQWTEGMRIEALANLAHELRTPLQVLLGYVDILRDEWADKFDPEPRAMLERMNSNLHDLTQTVDNIMEFVLSEAGATGRAEEDVSIRSLMNLPCDLSDLDKRTRPLTRYVQYNCRVANLIAALPSET